MPVGRDSGRVQVKSEPFWEVVVPAGADVKDWKVIWVGKLSCTTTLETGPFVTTKVMV